MNAPATMTRPGVPFLLGAAAFVVIVAGMRAADSIIVPFLLAVFVAIISAPALFWLVKKGLPEWLALLVVILGIAGIITIFSVTAASTIGNFTRDLPGYQQRLQELTSGLLHWLAKIGVEIPEEGLKTYLDPGAVMRLVANLLNGFGKVLGNAFLIFLTAVFILLEASGFAAKVRVAMDDPEKSLDHVRQIGMNVNHYLAIKTLTSMATGALVMIWLAVLGVDYFLLWGILAFLFNFIPNIGSFLAAVPAVLMALIQAGTGTAIFAAIGYAVINLTIGGIVEPKVMGRGLGVSTLVVFLSLVFWGWVLGPVGMFLSVPLTIALKIALASHEDTRWIAVMLGPDARPGR